MDLYASASLQIRTRRCSTAVRSLLGIRSSCLMKPRKCLSSCGSKEELPSVLSNSGSFSFSKSKRKLIGVLLYP